MALPKMFFVFLFSGFGDDLFGHPSVLPDGVDACVSVVLGSRLASGSYVAVVVKKALFSCRKLTHLFAPLRCTIAGVRLPVRCIRLF